MRNGTNILPQAPSPAARAPAVRSRHPAPAPTPAAAASPPDTAPLPPGNTLESLSMPPQCCYAADHGADYIICCVVMIHLRRRHAVSQIQRLQRLRESNERTSRPVRSWLSRTTASCALACEQDSGSRQHARSMGGDDDATASMKQWLHLPGAAAARRMISKVLAFSRSSLSWDLLLYASPSSACSSAAFACDSSACS